MELIAALAVPLLSQILPIVFLANFTPEVREIALALSGIGIITGLAAGVWQRRRS